MAFLKPYSFFSPTFDYELLLWHFKELKVSLWGGGEEERCNRASKRPSDTCKEGAKCREKHFYTWQHLLKRVLSSTLGPLQGGGTECRQVGVTGGRLRWAKRVCLRIWGRRGSCMAAESSWAPRVASFCWAAHLVLILSWSRNRRQKPTRRCPCDLCTGCCQTSS